MFSLKLAVSATIIATTSASFLRTDVQNEGCPLNTAKESCCGTTQCGTNNCFFFVVARSRKYQYFLIILFFLPHPLSNPIALFPSVWTAEGCLQVLSASQEVKDANAAGTSLCGDRTAAAAATPQAAGSAQQTAEAGSTGAALTAVGSGDTVANDQVQVHTKRFPKMPEAPGCKGIDCTPEENPILGDPERTGPGAIAQKAWNPSRSTAEGGVVKDLVTSVQALEPLGNSLRDKMMQIRVAHRTNQETLNDEAAQATDQAKKDYAIKVGISKKFGDEIAFWNRIVSRAKFNMELYKKKMAENSVEVNDVLAKYAEEATKSVTEVEAVITAIKTNKEETLANFNKLKDETQAEEKAGDSYDCKAKRQEKIDAMDPAKGDYFPTIDRKLQKLEDKHVKNAKNAVAEAANRKQVHTADDAMVLTYVKKYEEAELAFSTEVTTSLAAIKEKEAAMFKDLKEKVGASAADASASTSTVISSSSGPAIALGATAAADVAASVQASTADAAGDTQAAQSNAAIAPEGPSLLEVSGDTVAAPDAAAAGTAAAGGEPAPVLPEAARLFSELNDQVKAIKSKEVDGNVDKMQTDLFSEGMTHVDTMVTTLKDSLDVLKGYLKYYQVGSAQEQAVFKTTHDEIVVVIKLAVGKMKAKMMILKNAYRTIMGAMNYQQGHLTGTSDTIVRMKKDTDEAIVDMKSARDFIEDSLPTFPEKIEHECPGLAAFNPASFQEGGSFDFMSGDIEGLEGDAADMGFNLDAAAGAAGDLATTSLD